MGGVYRLTDKTILSAGYGLVWIEMAGITTPFTTPTFPFLQTASQRALDTINPAFVLQNGPTRRADRADADRRPRSGRLRRRRHARVGLRAAVERVGAAGADDEHHLRGGLRRIVHHPRRPSRHQPQSAVGQPARAGRVLEHARAEPVLRHHAAIVVARRSDDSGLAAAEAVSRPIPPSASTGTTSAPRGTTGSSSASASGSRAVCCTRSPTRVPSWSTMRRRCSTRRF